MKQLNFLAFTCLFLLCSISGYSQGTLTVTGNGNTIASGDVTPSVTDGTDFGTIIVGNNNPNTFVLDNTASGGSPGNRLNSIVVTITGSTDFTPATANLGNLTGNGTPINHIITFTPSSPGLKTATVTITFTNGTNSPYTFAIQGNGQAAVPEMDITGLGISIADGDTTPSTTDDTDFGTTAIGFPVAHTFTIHNLGVANLNLGATSITGANPLDFVVTTAPGTPVTPSGTTTFVITFNPTALGTRTATFSIVNDDSDENPYNFDLIGLATAPSPEMDVQGNATSIADNDITPTTADDTDFGNVDVTAGTNVNTFTILNTGTLTLNLTAASPYVTIGGAHAADFTVTAIPSNTIASGGGSTTFDITFNPSALGLRTATVTIANDDSDENPYNFNIQGTGVDQCGGYVSSFPYSEDFESGIGIWTQDTADNFDWTRRTGITPTASTGPSAAYSGSYYMHIETNSNFSNTANIFSPCFVLSGTTNPRMTVYIHMYGGHMGTLNIDMSTDNGMTYPINVFTKTQQIQNATTSAWIPVSLDLSSYVGQTVKFRIQGIAGGNVRSDMAIDYFSITDKTDPSSGPGGITADLSIWLKGTDGLSLTDGQSVSTWADQGRGSDARVQVSGQEPTYRDNATKNVNFNPVVEFDNSYNTFTVDGNYEYNDTSREFLTGEFGFYTQELFIVVIPDETPITNNFGFMDVFCSDAHIDQNATDATGIGFGQYTGRVSGEIICYAHDTFNTGESPADGYAVAEIGTGSSYDNVGIINTRNNAADTQQELFYNANDIETTQNDIPEYMNTNDGRWWLGRSEGWEASLNARVAEVISYKSRLADADLTQARNRVQSYLAIKYGITLGTNGTSQDYVDSNGTVIWDQSANAGFNYDIAGIGRDDNSDLLQKQSSSVNNATDGTGPIEGVLTMGLTDIYTTNNENISTNPDTFNDREYLVWGNNGASLNGASIDVTVDMSEDLGDATLVTNVDFTAIPRIWKVVETGGDVSTVKVSLPSNAVRTATPPDGRYLMFISSTGVFDPTAEYRVMTESGGTLSTEFDFDGTKYITFGWAPERTFERSIFFDAANSDFIDMGDNLDLNPTGFTVSTWIKPGNNTSTILSKSNSSFTEGYEIRILNDNRVQMRWWNGSIQTVTSNVAIPQDEWHHIAVTYDGTDATIYVDGVLSSSAARSAPISTTRNFLVGARGRLSTTAFFEGNIDEVRVWNSDLTADQIRMVMNQEIEDNASFVGGSYFVSNGITPTKNDIASVPWSDLAGYYPMSTYTYTNTKDESGNGIQGALRNLKTVDWQTAPLPYTSTQNGPWQNQNTWENGDVQTIPGTTSIVDSNISVDWNIVQIDHNVDIQNAADLPAGNNDNRNLLALFVNSNTLTVEGNTASGEGYGLTVTHYLDLDGDIDLEGESQLIQTEDSDLEVTSSGRLERDQQGTADLYTYNYWSSPVGISNITSNNNSFTLPDILRDGTLNINFLTSGYNGTNTTPIGIADFWIWKFANQPDDDYSSWQHVRSSGTLNAGEGFTMKGPGSGAISDDQNYVFLGKPNNGDINLTLSAGNDYLVGNPYPSALDAEQFILDNGATISGAGATTGTLYFWEHWGGGSHALQEYLGGYATYNLSGGTPSAAQGTNDPDVGTGGTPTKTPGRYIPVGQGFFVVAETAGTINFNNGQRVFQRESVNSVFMEAPQNNNPVFNAQETAAVEYSIIPEDPRTKLRIGFNSVNTIRRQMLLTIDENASAAVDSGYDAILNEDQVDDMFWIINDEKCVIQGLDILDENTVLPVGVHAANDGFNSIALDEFINAPENLKVLVHDIELELYHDLTESNYEFYMTQGEFTERFEIVFKAVDDEVADSDEDNPIDEDNTEDEDSFEDGDLIEEDISNGNIEPGTLNAYFSNDKDSIILVNPSNETIESVRLINVIGQIIYSVENINSEVDYTEYRVSNLSTGTYILKIDAESGSLTKKVLIE